LVLEKEQVIKTVVDPLKQHLTLMYNLCINPEDERIDYYTTGILGRKSCKAWALDTDAQSFFLNWHAGHMAKLYEGLQKYYPKLF
jgi:hypothetical protein